MGVWILQRVGIAGGVLALGMAFVLGCAPQPPPRFERVVLVSIDTLRSDRLGAYGYPRETSPFIDALADDGVLFERVYAPVPITAPSHATLFTGLHPRQHGLRSNSQRLAPGVVTLAERLQASGFVTAGFVSTRAQWEPTGLDRGFGHFDARAEDDPDVYRDARRTVDAVIRWLEQCDGCERLFLFVHLFDPHAPLRPPEDELDQFRGAGEEARAAHVAWLEQEQGIPLSFYRGDPGRMLFVNDRYDAEVRFADAQLRRLHEAMDEGGGGPTLWVVTSDHGEGLGNHAFMGHGKAYEEGLRVPLIFWSSDGSLSARRIEGIVQHVDLAPSLLELTGHAREEGPGRSLVAAMRGLAPPPAGPALAERGRIARSPKIRRLPEEDVGDLSGEQHALIESRFKLLHHTTGPDELYDLEADPHETHDLLATGGSPERARMLALLQERLAAMAPRESGAGVEIDAATRAELEALGYAP